MSHTHTPSLASVTSNSGFTSPRGDTPEPDSRQGRRNLGSVVQLLDDEGMISTKVCLSYTGANLWRKWTRFLANSLSSV